MPPRKPIKPPLHNHIDPIHHPKSPPSPISTSKLLLISMASLLCIVLLSFLLFFSTSSAARHRNHHHNSSPPPQSPADSAAPGEAEIIQACKATRYPGTCQVTLLSSGHVPPDPTPIQIIQSATRVSSDNLDKAQSMIQAILESSAGNPNRTTAAKNCLETLHNSEYRLNLTSDALTRARIKDGRAWLSAALAYQYDCWSGLKYVNDTKMVNETMAFMNTLVGYSSNALSMLASYDVFGNDTDRWGPPMTERDGFWGGSDGSGSGSGSVTVGFPTDLNVDVAVCKNGGGGCKYETVQEAVDAAPENSDGRFVIWIKEGVYEETVRVGLEKRNVVFLGDGMGKSIITGSLNVGQPGISTYNTATVGVVGDGFMATGLTIQNTAGPDAHQAVAFRSDSDLSILENCELLGNQDTLYAHSLRQFYKSCRIEGNVDFIFGNSAAVFQDCQILVRPRQLKPEKGESNAVTAHGRTDPAQATGFVFENCLVNGTEEYMALYYSKPSVHKSYLGRPWKEYSRTVFISCIMEALVTLQGWMPWSGDFALSTLYYGEYDNSGLGANLTARVSWSSQIPAEHVNIYSVQNFIQADEWLQRKVKVA